MPKDCLSKANFGQCQLFRFTLKLLLNSRRKHINALCVAIIINGQWPVSFSLFSYVLLQVFFKKMCLFFFIFFFSIQLTVNKYYIQKFIDDQIWTADLGCRMRCSTNCATTYYPNSFTVNCNFMLNKGRRWLDSIPGSLVLEAIACKT